AQMQTKRRSAPTAELAPVERYPDLRPAPTNVGERTLDGTRAAVRTVIRYRNGVLNARGASLLDGYMEDLATDRIYRLMIAQRMEHRGKVPILNGDGKDVPHSKELIRRRSEEHTAELQSRFDLVCRLLLEK